MCRELARFVVSTVEACWSREIQASAPTQLIWGFGGVTRIEAGASLDVNVDSFGVDNLCSTDCRSR